MDITYAVMCEGKKIAEYPRRELAEKRRNEWNAAFVAQAEVVEKRRA